MKLKVKKCQFLQKELEFLGHKVTAEEIKMQEGKIRDTVNYPEPRYGKSLQRFLGRVGYYLPFIRNFATIASPLTRLLRKETAYHWGTAQTQAFESLKTKFTENPILLYPVFSRNFYLACDASDSGVGAALLQKGSKRLMPVSYKSNLK